MTINAMHNSAPMIVPDSRKTRRVDVLFKVAPRCQLHAFMRAFHLAVTRSPLNARRHIKAAPAKRHRGLRSPPQTCDTLRHTRHEETALV